MFKKSEIYKNCVIIIASLSLAQVVYAARKEMAYNMEDIVLRRTGLGTLGNPGNRVLWRIAGVAANELNWNIIKRIKEFIKIKRRLEIPKK